MDNWGRWVYDSRFLREFTGSLEGPWGRSRLEPGRESSSTWGSGLSKGPWVKGCGLPRLSVDWSIQTRGVGIWWALRVSLKGGLCSRPRGSGRLLISIKEGGHLVEVLTGLAGVSSRTCRLPAPQTDAEAATACSSSGKLSTVLSMILPRTITMSQQLQRSWGWGEYNGEMMGNIQLFNYLRL